MASLHDVCRAVCDLFGGIGDCLSKFDESGLYEEARKLNRVLRQFEAFVIDIEPRLKGVRAWSSLREIEGALSALLQALLGQCFKGPLLQYLQADRTVACFSAAAARLASSLEKLQPELLAGPCHACTGSSELGSSRKGRAVDDGYPVSAAERTEEVAMHQQAGAQAHEELCCLCRLLRDTRFTLTPAHEANLQRFRHACDSLQSHFAVMLECCGGIMDHTLQTRLLSKESFVSVIQELQQEVEVQQQLLATLQSPAGARAFNRHAGLTDPLGAKAQQQLRAEQARQCEAEQHYMRMLMDAVRACHINNDCEAPLEFICPLTHRIMQEPVLLHETGHSYERKALLEWWAKGHRFCPRTGVHLKRIDASPNHNLRSAIERWQLHGDLHLTFRPVLNTMLAQQQQQVPRGPLKAAAAWPGLEDRLRILASAKMPAPWAGHERSCSGSDTSQGEPSGVNVGAAEAAESWSQSERCEDNVAVCVGRVLEQPALLETGCGDGRGEPCGKGPLPVPEARYTGKEQSEGLGSGSPCDETGPTPCSSSSTGQDSWEGTGRCSSGADTPQRPTSQEFSHAHSMPSWRGDRGDVVADELGGALSSVGLLGEHAGSSKKWGAPGQGCDGGEGINEVLGTLRLHHV